MTMTTCNLLNTMKSQWDWGQNVAQVKRYCFHVLGSWLLRWRTISEEEEEVFVRFRYSIDCEMSI